MPSMLFCLGLPVPLVLKFTAVQSLDELPVPPLAFL
jgi:hypothetical protein